MKRLMFCLLLVSGLLASSIPVNAGAESVTIISMSKPKLTKSEVLPSVSCVSIDFCVAAGMQNLILGTYSPIPVSQTLIKIWDGSAWSVVQSPNSGTVTSNYLTKVACVSRTFCKAVGSYTDDSNVQIKDTIHPLIMTWNGATWSLDVVPDVSLRGGLTGLSCPSISSCFAVGSTKATKNPTVLSKSVFMQWDGLSWVIQTTEAASLPSSVSCASSTFCMTVGNDALIQTWDGLNWTTVPTPNLNASQTNMLFSVSCVSSAFCMAVGQTGVSSATSAIQTLALLWDGTSWTLSQSPNTAIDRGNYLSNVFCISTTNCLASGSGQMGPVTAIAAYEQLVRWGGTNWSYAVQPGSEDLKDINLGGVACVLASWCMIMVNTNRFGAAPQNSKMSILLRPAKAALVSTAKKTLAGSKLTKNAGITVPKGAEVALTVSKKHKKICSVVGSTVKTVLKGTCLVSVVVTTKTGQKTSSSTSIKVK